MPILYFQFFIALFILVLSANLFVKYIREFAKSIRISELIIAATIVAIGTSLPELAVTISSLFENAALLSLGTIIGSNISNIGLIIGLSILLFPVRIGTEKTQRNNFIFLTVMLFFLGHFVLPHVGKLIFGSILLISTVVYLFLEYSWGKKGRMHEDRKYFKSFKSSGFATGNLIISLVTLMSVIISSKYLVTYAIQLAQLFKLDPEFIGLTIIAVGTSLPELSTSILAGIKKDSKLLLGDILGSNIVNLTLMGGLIIIFSDGTGIINKISLGYLFFFTIFLFGLIQYYKGRVIPRVFGLLMILIYLIYLLNIYYF